MKVRNILIGLLVVLMAFVFISCEDEPEEQVQPQPQPGPVDNTIYKLTATKGLSDGFYKYDKFVLDFNEEIYEGDTISLLFRSSRDVYQVSIRSIDGDTKYVYEIGVDVEDKPYTLEDMDDGWTKLSYTFGEGVEADNFRVDFRVRTIVGDFIEIKNVFIGNKSITLSEANVDTETYGSVLPTFAETADHDWVTDSTYTVAFFTAKPHYEDDYPVMQAVVKGGKISTAELTNDGYYIDKIEVISDFHKDGDMVLAEFDPETSTIDADTNLLVTWKGVDRTVTFETNGAAPLAAKTVENGQLLVLTNEEQPQRDLYMFSGWYTDAGFENAFNLATTPVTSDLTLYAKWILAANAKTVTIDLNTDCDLENLAAGDILANLVLEEGGFIDDEYKPEADQYYPGFLFEGWYVGDSETPFDFDAAVNENVVVSARWTPGTLYKLVAKHSDSEDLYSYDKIAVEYHTTDIDDDDVLSFRFRTTRPFEFFSVRRVGGGKKWVYQNDDKAHNYGLTTFETKADGWTYVTFVFNHTTAVDSADIPATGADFEFHFGNRDGSTAGITKGDILEIQGWAINNNAIAITASDVDSYADATLSTIPEINAGATPYLWTDHTVTFETGEGSPIGPIVVEFNTALELPDDPVLPGSALSGWFTDSEFEHPFDATTLLTEDITLYAKYAEAMTVTFNGATVDPITVAKGNTVSRPDDPVLEENVFGGWFADALFETPFDFTAPIDVDTIIYAKWIPSWTVTLNYNYGETPETKAVYVAKGDVMATPANISRVGFFFGGWCDDAAGTTPHNFSAPVGANATIYAKWNAPEEAYQFTSTVADTRWQFRWHEENVAMFNGTINPGDVFTLMLKFPEGNTLAENYWRLRTRNGEKHITENISFSSTPKDGDWYLITATVPEGITNGSGLYLQVYGADEVNWPVGSVMIIKAFAYNGQAIEIDARDYGTASTRKGAYEKICPNGAVIAP